VIDSRYSFHLAGGVRRIVGRDVSLRLESVGPVGSIVVTPGLGAVSSRFVGQVVAPRIAEIFVAAGTDDAHLNFQGAAQINRSATWKEEGHLLDFFFSK
jgi:hypothetical protein